MGEPAACDPSLEQLGDARHDRLLSVHFVESLANVGKISLRGDRVERCRFVRRERAVEDLRVDSRYDPCLFARKWTKGRNRFRAVDGAADLTDIPREIAPLDTAAQSESKRWPLVRCDVLRS